MDICEPNWKKIKQKTKIFANDKHFWKFNLTKSATGENGVKEVDK